jgi:hypothetical protein
MAGIAAIPPLIFGACTGLAIGITVGVTLGEITKLWYVGLITGILSCCGSSVCIGYAGIQYVFKDYNVGRGNGSATRLYNKEKINNLKFFDKQENRFVDNDKNNAVHDTVDTKV